MVMKEWSLTTKFLHVGLLTTVTLQLITSLVMDEPDDDGSLIGMALFEAHELIGLTALGIVLLHWLWSLVNYTNGDLKHLFPWGAVGRQQIASDIKALLRFEMPQGGKRGGLPGLIHGLGLLAVSGAALTGGMLFLLYPEFGEPGALAEGFEELHEGLATLVWTYWVAHGSIAVLHHLSGHDTVKKMFTFTSEKDQQIENVEKNHS